MIKKALLGLVALSVLAASASVAVFAAAFALFALLATYVGAAGAAGIIALVAILIVVIGALLIVLKLRGPDPRYASQGGSDAGLAGRLFALAKEKPLLTVSAAAAVAVIAFRNPKLVTALITGILAGKASPKN